MNITWDIAWRYLKGKKGTNAIQIITGISTFGLAFGTAAIIIILSVFNGFESVVLDMHSQFNPDLKVTPAKGKWMSPTEAQIDLIRGLPGVVAVSQCLEELAVFEHAKRQEVGALKGVDAKYRLVTGIDSMVTRGDYMNPEASGYPLVLGLGMTGKLGLNVYDPRATVTIHTISQKKHSLMARPIQKVLANPLGAFRVGSDADYNHVLTTLSGARRLFGRSDEVSSLELLLDKSGLQRSDEIAVQIQKILDEPVRVEDRMAQQADTVKVMRLEKWLAFIILLLVIVLVALNLVGAIWMIVIDKNKDFHLLSALGGDARFLRMIVIRLGLLICMIGVSFGILLAVILYFLQENYQLIRLGENSVVQSYPMEMRLYDFPIVISLVFLIGIIAVLLPAYRIGKPDYQLLR